MSKSVANVEVSTDTFTGWVSKTNILLDTLTNEIVTVESTADGANTTGNGSVIGILSANVLTTDLLRGGGVGNTANIATLTIGFSNSTVSSNTIVTGYTANVTSNNLNISSNTVVNGANVRISSANVTIDNGTVRLGSNTTSVVNSTTLSIASNVNITGANTTVNTANAYVTGGVINIDSNTSIYGLALAVTSNTSINAANVLVNGLKLTLTSNVYTNGLNFEVQSSNTFISGGNVTLQSNATLNGNTVTVSSNLFSISSVPNVSIVSTNTAVGGGALNISSNASLTGNTVVISSNLFSIASVANVSVASANVIIGGGALYITSNSNVNAALVSISSNVSITGANTFIDNKLTVDDIVSVSANVYVNTSILYSGNNSALVQSSGSFGYPGDGTTSNQVSSFALNDFRSGKLSVSAYDTANTAKRLITEIAFVQGQGNVHTTEYGTIFSHTRFMTFTLSSNSTHVNIGGVSNSTVSNVNVTILGTMFK